MVLCQLWRGIMHLLIISFNFVEIPKNILRLNFQIALEKPRWLWETYAKLNDYFEAVLLISWCVCFSLASQAEADIMEWLSLRLTCYYSKMSWFFSLTTFTLYVLKVFSSWMHFCAVRLFSESILRYGLPPSFLVLYSSRQEVRSYHLPPPPKQFFFIPLIIIGSSVYSRHVS